MLSNYYYFCAVFSNKDVSEDVEKPSKIIDEKNTLKSLIP